MTEGGPRPKYGRIAALSLAVAVTATALFAGSEPSASSSASGGGLSLASQPGSAAPSPVVPSPSPSTSPAPSTPPSPPAASPASLPVDSGSGRRVVFDISDQRLWLVAERDRVERSYLVSGSVYDNLAPGSYEVYSRSRYATGIDGSALQFMVRFAHGENAAIGFHNLPVLDGKRMQSRDELGTPLSHGCVRQADPDARAMWRFAPVGTTVVVTA